MSYRISRRTFVHGLGSAAVVTAAMGRHAHAAGDWQDGASPEWTRTLNAARQEGRVTVAGFPALAKPMAEAFQRDTGIQLEFFSGGSYEQSSRFEAEARAKNVTMDILIGGGRELGAVKSEGFLEPVKPQLILPGVDGKHYRDGVQKWMDDDKQYLLQGAQWVFGWLLVNKNVINPDEIKTWKDALDPKFRGKIISHDVRSPGPGQGASNFLHNVFGIEYIKAFFLGQDVKFTANTRQVVEEVVRGTKPIAFGSIQFDIESFRKAGINHLAVVLPDDVPGYVTGGFSVLKQAKGVPHPNAAKVFNNWYVSKPGQEVYQAVMMETSRRLDVDKSKLPAYLIPREGVKYFEDYNESMYKNRSAVVKLITDALGSR